MSLLAGGMVFLISALLVSRVMGLIVLFSIWLLSVIILRMSWRGLGVALRKTWILLLLTFCFHAVLSGSRTVESTKLLDIHLNVDSIFAAVLFTFRIALILTVGVALFQNYPAQRFGREMGRVLSKLPFGRKTLAQVELMVTLALRFVPFLESEFHRLKLALAARGTCTKRTVSAKLMENRRIIFPLITHALHRADSVALALEARGYDPNIVRTSLYSVPIPIKEVLFALIFTGFCIVAVMV
jgi:energy-coupling factor transport system permease protein